MSESAAHSHDFEYRDVDGKTWNVCACGFRELWEGGTLCDSTDWHESNRLDGWEVADGVEAP